MDTTCPNCSESFKVADNDHYNEVECPKCNEKFQAFSDTTQKLTRDFLDQVLKRSPTEE